MGPRRHRPEVAVRAVTWTVRAVAGAAAPALFALVAVASLGAAQGRVYAADTTKVIDASAIAASVRSSADSIVRSVQPVATYRSRADSVASVRIRLAAEHDNDLRVVVSLNDRELWAIMGPDTLLTAPIAVSTDETLEYAGKSWRFETPRGVRTVIDKKENPVWIPPEWHYAEVAQEHGLKLAAMIPGKTVLSDGRVLDVRDDQVGVVDGKSGAFAYLPTDEEVIFDGTLFIPPIGTLNRRIEGELGRHMLDTGNGFLLHGTPDKASIGTAATHGCIRLRDADIAWLYDMIPVGTRVYIY
jgi:L,D-transpeptidase-like protein